MAEGSALELPDTLRTALDAGELRPLVEYVAARLGCDDGIWTLEFGIDGGNLRRAHMKRGPIGDRELEVIGRREPPPL